MDIAYRACLMPAAHAKHIICNTSTEFVRIDTDTHILDTACRYSNWERERESSPFPSVLPFNAVEQIHYGGRQGRTKYLKWNCDINASYKCTWSAFFTLTVTAAHRISRRSMFLKRSWISNSSMLVKWLSDSANISSRNLTTCKIEGQINILRDETVTYQVMIVVVSDTCGYISMSDNWAADGLKVHNS